MHPFSMEIPERRLSKRLNVSLPITYEYLGGQRHAGATVTKDISRTGMRMNMDAFFASSSPFSVKIRFSDIERIIEATARVAWSHRLSHSDQYQAGLQFDEISPISKRWLEEYILIHEILEKKE